VNGDERRALSALSRFDWTMTREDVWSPLEGHVEALNGDLGDEILAAFAETAASPNRSPLGFVITGQRGAGKTHLIAWTRAQIQARGGYFFQVGLLQENGFWQNIVHTLLSELHRPFPGGEEQLTVILDRLCKRSGVNEDVRAQVTGARLVTRRALDDFVRALRRTDPLIGRESRYTARALALLNAADTDVQDIGEGFLTSQEEAEAGEWAAWGLRPPVKPPAEIVTELSCLLGLTGPSVLAIDQIDTLIAQHTNSADLLGPTSAVVASEDRVAAMKRDLLAAETGDGLMELREKTRRTLIVVSCLLTTWELIKHQAVDTVVDRFRADRRLERIPSAEAGSELVRIRFAPRFAEAGFIPPYPTWPVHPDALTDAPRFTPRGLLKRVDRHIRDCIRAGTVRPLSRLDEASGESPLPPELADASIGADQTARFDREFDYLKRQADIGEAIVSGTEDAAMPPLLSAGLRSWILEQGVGGGSYFIDPAQGRSPAWHARLHRTLDESSEDELHWAFRSIAGPHHNAVRTRVQRMRIVTGLNPEVRKRKAFILRTRKWEVGPKTQQKIKEFEDAGGVIPGPFAGNAAQRSLLIVAM
jgi:hypothetical protein